MKAKLHSLFSSLPKRIFAGALLTLAVLLPVAQSAAVAVNIEGTMGVANVTAGDTTYKANVGASYNQVVKLQVYYHNTELPDSDKVAQNLRVKVDIPSTPGTTQTQTATISADNTNTVTKTTTVTLDRADAYLQYLPGSAVWRHNTGTDAAPVWTDTVLADTIVNNGTGLVLEDEKPCYNFSATVTVLARVMVPGVSVDKQVRVKGTTGWTTNLTTAKPGETVEYLISYKNTGNVEQKDVVVADKLPEGVSYVAGTSMLANGDMPQGKGIVDGIVGGDGIIIGTYPAGINAFVKFEAKLPAAEQLSCGQNLLRNIATVQPSGMNYYYNTADVVIQKDCQQPTPVYSCDALTVDKKDGRNVTATVKYTAKDGATYKNTTITWGDSKQDTITGDTASHSYTADGTYTVTAKPLFTVNGTDKAAADNPACSKTVTFTTASKTPSVKIEKLVDGKKSKEVKVGETYTYSVKVTNDGEVDLAKVVVSDTPASGITLVKANEGGITGNTWSYVIPALKVGESKSFTLTAKVEQYKEGSLVNTACVNAPEVNPGEPTKDDACDTATVTVPKPVTPTPVYSCDALTLTAGVNRTLTAKVDYTAKDGATLKMVTYNWGDTTTPLVTDKTSADHTYASDGTYSVSVKLLFNVNGADKYAADSAACVKSVTYTSPTQPGKPTTPTTPQVLPNTGVGSVVGLFGLVSVLGAVGYRVLLSRRLARR